MQYNFSNTINIKRTILNIEGWIPDINIEYGFTYDVDGKLSILIWRLEDTIHTFGIDIRTVTQKHNSNYEEHFRMTLIQFRKDLIEWVKEGLKEEWMLKYYQQFYRLII